MRGDIDDGVVEGQTSSEQNELVQLRRAKRTLEIENECAELRLLRRRQPAGMNYPLVRDLAAEGIRCG